MSERIKISRSTLKIERCDITDIDVESFVFYAREDLKVGSGFGTAISVRGGPSVQKKLDEMAPIGPNECVITDAGELKAKHIIHANGPKFQEEGTDEKLRTTIVNALKLADKNGIKQIAFPPMGYGFYGVPLEKSAALTLETIKSYLENQTNLEEVIVCLWDNKEYRPFRDKLQNLN